MPWFLDKLSITLNGVKNLQPAGYNGARTLVKENKSLLLILKVDRYFITQVYTTQYKAHFMKIFLSKFDFNKINNSEWQNNAILLISNEFIDN